MTTKKVIMFIGDKRKQNFMACADMTDRDTKAFITHKVGTDILYVWLE